MSELCAAIAVEKDSSRMLRLAEELNQLLETNLERLERMNPKPVM